MDRIQKALKKLSEKEKAQVKTLLQRLRSNQLQGLDIKKLKGHSDILRVRKGDIRIIYRQKADDIFVLAIERRSEKTYRDF